MRKLGAAVVLLFLVATGSAGGQSVNQAKMFGVFESSRLDLVVQAGFTVVEKDLWVTPGYQHYADLPQADRDQFESYMAYAQKHGLKVVLNLWQTGWPVDGKQLTPPLLPHQWRGMSDVAVDVVKKYPSIVAVVPGVEPNKRYFWSEQTHSGSSYESWLAIFYTKVKKVRPDVMIYGGSLASQAGPGDTSPQDFIAQMCQAYQQSGRTQPIMDGFDMHWYASGSPATKHTDSIGIGDGDRLESLLACFGSGTMPILWGEGGYSSQIPSWQMYRYAGVLPSAIQRIDEDTQAAWYAQAVQLVQCQPYSVGLFVFHMVDDPQLSGWQSGMYYANPDRHLYGSGGHPDAAKKSLGAFAEQVQAASSGEMHCR